MCVDGFAGPGSGRTVVGAARLTGLARLARLARLTRLARLIRCTRLTRLIRCTRLTRLTRCTWLRWYTVCTGYTGTRRPGIDRLAGQAAGGRCDGSLIVDRERSAGSSRPRGTRREDQ